VTVRSEEEPEERPLAAPRVIWITGASTGLGRALALSFAKDGVTVAASARSAEKLAELAAADPRIKPYPLDVTDREAVQRTVAAIEATVGPIDLAVLNAGLWHNMASSQFDTDKIVEALSVNYLGIVYALEGLIPRMRGRGAGHLALMASVAGYMGLPRGIAYNPTKAAAISLAESLHDDLARFGIAVSVINPGFVDTPMTAVNTFPMPWIMPVEAAVGHIRRGLDKRRFEIAFPWQMVLFLKLARLVPYAVRFAIMRRMLDRVPGLPD